MNNVSTHLTWENIKEALAAPFPPESIHWRVGATTQDKSKGIALAYIDARDVQNRLDEVCGADWQCRYPLTDGKLLICDIGIRIDGRWRWRGNGAGDTDVEAEKGKASDAFKRAAVMWGIGRYLYALPNEWMPLDERKRLVSVPTLPAWAVPVGSKAPNPVHTPPAAQRPAPVKPDAQRPASVRPEADPKAKDELWRLCLEAAGGNDQVKAEAALKALTFFIGDSGRENYLTLAGLRTARKDWVDKAIKNFSKPEYRQKIKDALDDLPY